MYILTYLFIEITSIIYNEPYIFNTIVYEIINSKYACDICIISAFMIENLCVQGKFYSQNILLKAIFLLQIPL